MKKCFVLSIVALITSSLLANDNALKNTGEKFCEDIIDQYSPGSNHVMDCLDTVGELIELGIADQQSLVRAICKQAPNFAYSMGGCTEEECLNDAVENYLK